MSCSIPIYQIKRVLFVKNMKTLVLLLLNKQSLNNRRKKKKLWNELELKNKWKIVKLSLFPISTYFASRTGEFSKRVRMISDQQFVTLYSLSIYIPKHVRLKYLHIPRYTNSWSDIIRTLDNSPVTLNNASKLSSILTKPNNFLLK